MNEESACQTCERKLKKAGAVLRCEDWRRFFDACHHYNLGFSFIDRCSRYVGPHPESHVKIFWGAEYSDTLRHARNG